ncbi:MAG: pyridoxal-phosphate dependent enzyme, partial [Bacteroidota bacterium]
MSKEFTYVCVNCQKRINTDAILYICPDCAKENKADKALKGVLKIIYPYTEIKKKLAVNPDYLIESDYIDLLPIDNIDSYPPLLVGKTPLYTFEEEIDDKQSFTLHLKVESGNPTFSFKDRASALVSAFAKEKGIDILIAASTGNAGSSLAGICASQKQKAILLVPENAPKAKLTQVLMYGAKLIPVRGNYDDAYELSLKLTEKYGLYNRNTAFNPLTIEGKKTVSFELYEQMKAMPDKVFVPVGDGVILSGIYKGFEDLLNLGLISKIPQIIA